MFSLNRKERILKTLSVMVAGIFLWNHFVWASGLTGDPTSSQYTEQPPGTSPESLQSQQTAKESLVDNKMTIEDVITGILPPNEKIVPRREIIVFPPIEFRPIREREKIVFPPIDFKPIRERVVFPPMKIIPRREIFVFPPIEIKPRRESTGVLFTSQLLGEPVHTYYASDRMESVTLATLDEDWNGKGYGRLIKKTNPDGSYTTFGNFYVDTDQARLVEEYDAENTGYISYISSGRLHTKTLPDGIKYQYYDEDLDRLWRVIRSPNGRMFTKVMVEWMLVGGTMMQLPLRKDTIYEYSDEDWNGKDGILSCTWEYNADSTLIRKIDHKSQQDAK